MLLWIQFLLLLLCLFFTNNVCKSATDDLFIELDMTPRYLKPGNKSNEDFRVFIPISFGDEVNGKGQIRKYDAEFSYYPLLSSNTLEHEVYDFCVLKSVFRSGCVSIFSAALRLLREAGVMANNVAGAGTKILAVQYPVAAVQEAFDAQRVSTFRLELTANLTGSVIGNDELDSEERINRLILHQYSSKRSKSAVPARRVCFIHSVMMTEEYRLDLLSELLDALQLSGLDSELSNIWVLNYGRDITSMDEYAALRDKYKSVNFIQRSSDKSLFEMPTLRHIAHFARSVTNPATDPEREVQVLYLHTKGVSYLVRHPPIDDWIRLMLYFAVEQHRRAFHLLSSGEFLAVGCNLQKVGGREGFQGNFWWAAAGYLARIPPMDWTAPKYEAESWVTSYGARLYSFHNSDADHYRERYPRIKYAIS